MDDITRRTAERFGPPSADPFEQSRRYHWEALHNEIQWASLAASWAVGAFINLASPAHLLSPPVSQLPRTGLYATPRSFLEKVYNYAFRSGNALYSWLLMIGTLGLVAIHAVQVVGFYVLVRRRALWPALLLAGSWIVFLLLLNGPRRPKYRLPLEPLFDILAGAGLLSIWIHRRRYPRVGSPLGVQRPRGLPLRSRSAMRRASIPRHWPRSSPLRHLPPPIPVTKGTDRSSLLPATPGRSR
jgi:hypothetical protein